MIGISATAPTTPTRSAPRVVRGLAYGVLVSIIMWTAIGAVIYNFV